MAKWQRDSDGTYTIQEVPILELGNVKGLDLDETWGDRAVAFFQSLKTSKGYLPSVFVGHNSDDDTVPERPSVGLLDNLRRVGKTLIADIRHVSEEVFAQIKAGMWPYRSIEFFPKSAEITGLALLGSREPYIKTPPLLFAADDTRENDAYHVESDTTGDTRLAVVSSVPVTLSTQEPTVMSEEPKDGGTQEEITSPEQDEQPERISPERLAELESKLERLEADLAESQKENEAAKAQLAAEKERAAKEESARRAERVELFRERVTNRYGIAPALIEHPAFQLMLDTFSISEAPIRLKADGEDSEKEVSGLDALETLIVAIREQADKSALFVDREEYGRVPDVKDSPLESESYNDAVTRLSNERYNDKAWHPELTNNSARRMLAISEAKEAVNGR